MRILITGACGFAGSALAESLLESLEGVSLVGLDNFSRPGSELNRLRLKRLGVRLLHADIRNASDVDALPAADWVLDAAANPSVLAGVDGQTSSRQLVEHNLLGTVNLLEYCRRHRAGLILLSTSRVYNIAALAALPMKAVKDAFALDCADEITTTSKGGRRKRRPYSSAAKYAAKANPPNCSPSSACDDLLPPGVSAAGIAENFSTAAPISLYGATKLAAETLSLEYGEAYDLPVWVNRCGVLAGAGQFGRPDQGIFSYWIHSHRARRPLKYIGFSGHGHQVRDCLHPRDLVPLLRAQFRAGRGKAQPRIVNVSGGVKSATSLRNLTAWCDRRFAPHKIIADKTPRPYDLPWIVLDSALAHATWQWSPATSAESIFEEIARHADANPSWLDLSAP